MRIASFAALPKPPNHERRYREALMHGRPINRRLFLAGSASLAALTACGSSGPSGLEPMRLGVRFPDGFVQASIAVADNGPQRFPFVVIADDGLPMLTGAPESIEIEVLKDGATLMTQTVQARGVGQFIPYYPLEFTPTETGSYLARTDFSDLDVEFIVTDRSSVAVPQVGDAMSPFDTPTFDDSRGVDPICTRAEPCPFHSLTLTEALANDKPTALLVSTPGFCQTDVCGPSVEFLIDAVGARTDINVIHAEVYQSYQEDLETGGLPTVAPLLPVLGLDFEPSLFVADATGTIVGVRHFAFDRDETQELIDLL